MLTAFSVIACAISWLRVGWRRVAQALGPVALALVDAGGHEERAQHDARDPVADQRQVLVQRLAQRHHGMLADVVDAHVGRVQQAGHRRGVDDVPFVAGVIRCGCLEHERREHPHAVRDAHQVDTDHPLPVASVCSQTSPPAPTPALLKTKCGAPKRSIVAAPMRLDLGGLRHVERAGSTCAPSAADLARGQLQRVGLHVGHHDVHARAGGMRARSRVRSPMRRR